MRLNAKRPSSVRVTKLNILSFFDTWAQFHSAAYR